MDVKCLFVGNKGKRMVFRANLSIILCRVVAQLRDSSQFAALHLIKSTWSGRACWFKLIELFSRFFLSFRMDQDVEVFLIDFELWRWISSWWGVLEMANNLKLLKRVKLVENTNWNEPMSSNKWKISLVLSSNYIAAGSVHHPTYISTQNLTWHSLSRQSKSALDCTIIKSFRTENLSARVFLIAPQSS